MNAVKTSGRFPEELAYERWVGDSESYVRPRVGDSARATNTLCALSLCDLARASNTLGCLCVILLTV